jgi:acyl carrier protein
MPTKAAAVTESPIEQSAERVLYERRADIPYKEPSNDIERSICDVWQDALGLDRVGVEDSFFALGGNSLIATRVVSRLREMYAVDLPLQVFFLAPTVMAIASMIGRASQSHELGELVSSIEVLDDETVRAEIQKFGG